MSFVRDEMGAVTIGIGFQANHFGDKVCPFYKTTEQNEKEKKAVMDRLIAMGRQDLIDTYYGGKEGGVDNGC